MKFFAGDWLVIAVGVLQASAAVSYGLKRRWVEAAIWLGAAIITFGTFTLSRRAM